MAATGSTATGLSCPRCHTRYAITEVLTLCRCGAPLLVDYDYDTAARLLDRKVLGRRSRSIWRYREILPVRDEINIVTLGEGGTPLIRSVSIGRDLGLSHLYFKDETVNPTGSFKARGLCLAVSRVKELGLRRLIMPTAGNAGSALAAYAARAGLECMVIMPADSPAPFLIDCEYHGARVELVDGTIKDCGRLAAQKVAEEGWFSIATLREPYRIEGKKTMGYELAEQFGFRLPDVIIYPTGGGTGLIGMWKAFDEMECMGWIDSRRPRMVAVQAAGCAPIPHAFAAGADHAEEWQDPATVAAGLRVPGAVGDFLILKAIRDSGGLALAVTDDELMRATKEIARREGILSSPEGGAALAAVTHLIAAGAIQQHDRVVIFLTGSGYKYLDVLERFK